MGFVVKAVKSVVKAVVKVVKGVFGVVGLLLGMSKPKNNAKNDATANRLSKRLEPEDFRKIIFGKTAMACDLRFWEVYGSKYDRYGEVLAAAGHRVHSFGDLYIEEEKVTFSGAAATGTYAGALSRTTNTGATGNAALAVGGGAYWNSNSKFTGTAHYALAWVYDEKKLPNGIPSRYTQEGQGALVYDPRKDSTRGGSGPHRADNQDTWEYAPLDSNGQPLGRNNALQMLWYLLGWRIKNPVTNEMVLVAGRGVDPADINWPDFITAANDAEALKFYTDMCLSTGDDHTNNESIISADGLIGELLDPGGLWTYKITKDDTMDVAVSLGEDDVVEGDVQWNPEAKLSDKFNEVAGTYVDPASLYQPKAYPTVKDEAYSTADGYKKRTTHNFQSVQDVALAQKLSRIKLNRNRFTGEFKATFNFRALRSQVWSIVELTIDRYGFDRKIFRVLAQTITDGGIEMVLREDHPSIYTGGTVTIPPPPSAFPDKYDTRREIPLTELGAVSSSRTGTDGSAQDGLLVNWEAPPGTVRRTEVEYKLSADTTWTSAGVVAAPTTSLFIGPLLPTATYSVRARHISVNEVPGPWSTAGLDTAGNTKQPADRVYYTSDHGAVVAVDDLRPAEAGSNVTGSHISLGIQNQGALATQNTVNAATQLVGTINIANVQANMLNENIKLNANGTITGAGGGQVTFGGLGGKALGLLDTLKFGDSVFQESAGVTATLANFKTTLGISAGILNQGTLATSNTVNLSTQVAGTLAAANAAAGLINTNITITPDGKLNGAGSGQVSYSGIGGKALGLKDTLVFGDSALQESSGVTATLANFKTPLGIAAGILNQGALAILNSVGPNNISANSISAKHLAIADTENWFADSDIQEKSPWINNSPLAYWTTTLPSYGLFGRSETMRINGNSAVYNAFVFPYDLPVTPGEQYYVEFWVRRQADWNGTNVNSKLRFAYASTNTQFINISFGAESFNAYTWVKKSATITIPSDCNKINIKFTSDATASYCYIAGATMRRVNGGELIVDGSISANHIAANSIQVTHMKANSVGTNQLIANSVTTDIVAAGAIKASKISIADFNNMIADSDLNDPAYWGIEGAAAGNTIGNTPAGRLFPRGIMLNPSSTNSLSAVTPLIKVEPNEEFYVSMYVGGAGLTPYITPRFHARWYNAAGVAIYDSTITVPVVTSTGQVYRDWNVVAPANAVGVVFRFGRIATASENDLAFISSPSVFKRNAAKLIVDGSISTNLLAAGSIVTKHLAVVDTGNIFADSEVQSKSGWIAGAAGAWVGLSQTDWLNNKPTVMRVSGAAGNAFSWTGPIPVSPGEQYYIEFWMRRSSAWDAAPNNSKLRFGTTTTHISSLSYAAADAVANTWTKRSMVLTIPSGVTEVLATMGNDSTTGNCFIQDLVMRRMNGGELIVDGAITTNHLIANSVTTAKIATGAVTANEIAANAIIAGKVAANAIGTTQLISGSVTTGILAANSVTAAKILAGAIGTDQLAANAIVAGKIAAGNIVGSHIASNAVTADKISVNSLSAVSSNLGSVTAGSININGLFSVNSSGQVVIKSAASGKRMEQDAGGIRIYNDAGVAQIELIV